MTSCRGTQGEILRFENIARRVIEQLQLLSSPDFADPTMPANDARAMRRALDTFKKRLAVDQVGQSYVIEVRVSVSDPQRAADMANNLVSAYLQDQAAANTATAQSASGWLRERMQSLGTTARVLSLAAPPIQPNGPGTMVMLATLDRYHQLYEQEIDVITQQIATEKRQYSAVEKELDSVKSLAEKGLASLSRQLTSERTLTQIAGTIQGLQATILRARQNISQTEQRRIETLNDRTSRISNDLQKARTDAKENAQRQRTAWELLMAADVSTPALQSAISGTAARFTISRTSGGKVQEISTDGGGVLQPGDVLVVLASSSAPSAASQPGSTKEPTTPKRLGGSSEGLVR